MGHEDLRVVKTSTSPLSPEVLPSTTGTGTNLLAGYIEGVSPKDGHSSPRCLFSGVEKGPDVVVAIDGTHVYVRWIKFGSGSERLRQGQCIVSETTEASSSMPQAEGSQSQERASWSRARAGAHAQLLDENCIVVVQCAPDEEVRGVCEC
ncbi:hypothetical protein ACQFYA_09805 [Promicromonospora sp. Marseille-Q5078]